MSPATMCPGEPKTAVPGPFTADELNAYGARSTATEKGNNSSFQNVSHAIGLLAKVRSANLTDKFWLRWKTAQIAQVIADGLPDKA